MSEASHGRHGRDELLARSSASIRWGIKWDTPKKGRGEAKFTGPD